MIRVSAHLAVRRGKMREFIAAMEKCRELVMKNEKATNTQYDWYVRDIPAVFDATVEAREEFEDSSAFLYHLENIKGPLGELLEVSTLKSLRVYGNPSAELLAVLEPLGAEIYYPIPYNP